MMFFYLFVEILFYLRGKMFIKPVFSKCVHLKLEANNSILFKRQVNEEVLLNIPG